MARFLSDIGDALELRKQVSRTDIHNTTISVVLDKPRTLEVVTKTAGLQELVVRCRDIDERVSIVLQLPFEEGAVASATIIDHTESNGV